MRQLSPALAAHLASGATTLCHCWRLETRDGEVLGFTDHDRDLSVDGVTYEADAGFTATEIDSSRGLAIDNLEASGALSSARLSEERLTAGDFDNASIEVWRVNWQDVSQKSLLRRGNLGEVTRGPNGFAAELRGLAHALNQPRGRIFQHGCDAILGDARCGVDLDSSSYAVEVVVEACEDRRRLVLSGPESFADGFFARGVAQFFSGANAGRSGEVKFHRVSPSGISVELWLPMPFLVAVGDRLMLRAGCDKQFATCKAKFCNAVNFRGFPHIPGDDFVLAYAKQGDPDNDGNSNND